MPADPAEGEWVAGLRARLAAVERELEVMDASRDVLAAEAGRLRAALASLQGTPGPYELIRQYVTATPGPYTSAAAAVFFHAAGWDDHLQGPANRAAVKALSKLHRDGELVIRERHGVYCRRSPGE